MGKGRRTKDEGRKSEKNMMRDGGFEMWPPQKDNSMNLFYGLAISFTVLAMAYVFGDISGTVCPRSRCVYSERV